MDEIDVGKYYQEMHAANGMNIFPIKHASKKTFGKWGFLQSTRLPNEKLPDLLSTMPANYAVVMGKHSRNLFSLDCDSGNKFREIGEYLHSRNIRTWVRSSPRGGQFFLYSGDGEICTDKRQSDIDILGKGAYAMLPHSIHPDTGEIIEWAEQPAREPETIQISDIKELKLKLAAASENDLPRVAYNILVCADYSDYGNDGSRGEFAAVQSLRSKGYDNKEILCLFRHHQPRHFCKIGEKEFVRAFVSYRRQGFRFDANCRHSQNAEKLIVWLSQNPLSGYRSAKTDTKMIQAIAEIIKQSGSYQVSASIRQLCELANIGGLDTATNSLHRLIDAKYVIPTDAQHPGLARRYEIDFDQFPEAYSVEVASADDLARTGDSSNDAFHHYGLGASGTFLLKNLSSEIGKSVPELAEQTKTSRRTVYRKLDLLITNALCFQDDGLYYATEFYEADLSRAAYELGTLGRTEAKSKRFLEQRENQAYKIIKSQMLRHAANSPKRQSVSKS